MSKRPEKRKFISTKTKIIIFAVLALLFFIFAMYLGMRFQLFLTSFMFRSYFAMIKFLFWAVLLIAIVFAVYVFYLIHKHKKKNSSKNKHE